MIIMPHLYRLCFKTEVNCLKISKAQILKIRIVIPFPNALQLLVRSEHHCAFPVKNNPDYDKPIKNQDIGDIAWQNILSHCDFTLRTAVESTTTQSDAYRFHKEHTIGISEKFTNTFNNILGGSIGRKYEFEVFFESSGDQLVVQLQISYRESDRESDKQSSWVDLNYESEGFQILMALCSYLFNDQDKSGKIFVMDEPFTNIHPKAQRQVSRHASIIKPKVSDYLRNPFPSLSA